MKKKIVITLILIITLVGSLYLFTNLNKGTTTKTNTVEISESDEIDWSQYDTYEIELNNEDVTISKSGVYYITGSLTDHSITVNTNDNVKIVLTDVTITNSNGSAIYIENAKNTYIELNGENTLESTLSGDIDATIYSKDDLFFEGEGTLNIKSNIDGISSSDDLTFYSGIYNIVSSDEGIKGKDSVNIVDGEYNIESGGDAIKTTNETEKGQIVIKDGTFNITSQSDGITSISTIQIEGGEFNIKTTGTSTNSMKGIKSEKEIIINGGTFVVDTKDDAIHSNDNLTLNGGTYTITSSDDGIHADGMLEINDGTYTITSQEGLEATYVKINGGTITISASDDGINAGSKSSNYTTTIEINGGDITIKMGAGDTDGIDSNGDIYINGGTINITGNSPFDYDGTAKYSGGTMIVNGSQTTSITNQMMGGGMQGGNQPGGSMMR